MSLLALHDVHVRFNTAGGVVRAVDGVSLELAVGETLGLVGESGCGKSTLGKAIMKLVPIASGEIVVDGVDIAPLGRERLAEMRRKVQMIFQDPYGSLNPRSTVGRSVAQPLAIAGWKPDATNRRVETLLGWVGLPSDAKQRYPHEFSGGQRQREPVSALDVSVRAQVINLLEDLKSQFGVSYLFISHDLSVVKHIADRVAVMYLGTLVEVGGRDQIWRNPQHPYTKALLAAAPIADPKAARARQRTVLQGELPSPIDPPAGCPFHSRCPIAQDRCKLDRPVLRPVGSGAQAACHFV